MGNHNRGDKCTILENRNSLCDRQTSIKILKRKQGCIKILITFSISGELPLLCFSAQRQSPQSVWQHIRSRVNLKRALGHYLPLMRCRSNRICADDTADACWCDSHQDGAVAHARPLPPPHPTGVLCRRRWGGVRCLSLQPPRTAHTAARHVAAGCSTLMLHSGFCDMLLMITSRPTHPTGVGSIVPAASHVIPTCTAREDSLCTCSAMLLQQGSAPKLLPFYSSELV